MAVKIRPPLVYPRNKDLVQSERTNRVSVAGLFVQEGSPPRESVLLDAREVAIYGERGENDCRITMSAGRQSAGINGPRYERREYVTP